MKWFFELLALLRGVTPEARAAIRKCLDDLAAAARQTANPVDDLAVGILRTICLILGLV